MNLPGNLSLNPVTGFGYFVFLPICFFPLSGHNLTKEPGDGNEDEGRDLDVILKICVKDLERFSTWKIPTTLNA